MERGWVASQSLPPAPPPLSSSFLCKCVHVYVHKVHFPVPKCVRGQRLSSRGLPCFWNRVSHKPRACHFGEASWAVSTSDPPVPIPSAGVTDACFPARRLCVGGELRSSCPWHALHPWHHFPSQHLLTSRLPSWKYPIIIQADWLSAHFYLPMSVFPQRIKSMHTSEHTTDISVNWFHGNH